jgi:GAF domain-containing protein
MADARLTEIMERLLDQTSGDRTTVRLEGEDGMFAVLAEAVSSRGWRIAGETSVDVSKAETVRWLARERKPLIQDDLESADPPVPRELIDMYGARAQMLGPLVRDESLIGIISVHRLSGPGPWSEQEQSALAEAIAEVEAIVNSEAQS